MSTDVQVNPDEQFPELAGMKPVPAHRVTYPNDFTFWRNGSGILDESHLQIINKEDFPLSDLLKNLGLSGEYDSREFGLCDRQEIEGRLSVMRFLFENPHIAELLNNLDVKATAIPNNSEDFLSHFDSARPHNPFWSLVNQLIEAIDACDNVPRRLAQFIDVLKQAQPLEKDETAMADVVKSKLFDTTVIEGIGKATFTFKDAVRIDAPSGFRLVGKDETLQPGRNIRIDLEKGCSWVQMDDDEKAKADEGEIQTGFLKTRIACEINPSDSEIFGHKMYSSSLQQAMKLEYPEWTTRWWSRIFNIREIGFKKARKQQQAAIQRAMSQMVISIMTEAIKDDLQDALNEHLNTLNWDETRLQVDFLTKEKTTFYVSFCFSYGKEGLNIRIIRVYPSTVTINGPFEHASYSGYGQTRRETIQKAISVVSKTLMDNVYARHAAEFERSAVKQREDFYRTFQAKSKRIDLGNRWFAIDNLLAISGMSEVSKACKQMREYVKLQTYTLKFMVTLLNKFIKKAKVLGAPLCIPTVLPDTQHLVAFESLYPMHLAFEGGGKPVAITQLPNVNGDMIGLSGHHGGGKSVTELTLVSALWLAQSGLPVFSDGFSFNVKQTIGLVFIGDGEGSTCQLLVRKTRNVLEAAANTAPNRMLVVLDEVGGATQEGDGFQFGTDVLTTLNKRGVSTVFSTQITNLLRFAEKNLGARIFKFDAKHRITPGIGTGNLPGLVKSEKLDQYMLK